MNNGGQPAVCATVPFSSYSNIHLHPFPHQWVGTILAPSLRNSAQCPTWRAPSLGSPKRNSLFSHPDAASQGLVECYLPLSHINTLCILSDGVETNQLKFITPIRKREDGKTQQSLVHSNYQVLFSWMNKCLWFDPASAHWVLPSPLFSLVTSEVSVVEQAFLGSCTTFVMYFLLGAYLGD